MENSEDARDALPYTQMEAQGGARGPRPYTQMENLDAQRNTLPCTQGDARGNVPYTKMDNPEAESATLPYIQMEAEGDAFVEEAHGKLIGSTLIFHHYQDALELLESAATRFEHAKAWKKAGETYTILSICHVKLGNRHEATRAYADAGKCYRNINPEQAIAALHASVYMLMEDGRLFLAASHLKEIAEIYEEARNLKCAMEGYDKAAELYKLKQSASNAAICKLKVAELASQREDYPKATYFYEEVAELMLGLRLMAHKYMFNAWICHLCGGDEVSIQNAMAKYTALDPSFLKSPEYALAVKLNLALWEGNTGYLEALVERCPLFPPSDGWKKDRLKQACSKRAQVVASTRNMRVIC